MSASATVHALLDGAVETRASETGTSCRSSPKTPCGQAAMQECASTGT